MVHQGCYIAGCCPGDGKFFPAEFRGRGIRVDWDGLYCLKVIHRIMFGVCSDRGLFVNPPNVSLTSSESNINEGSKFGDGGAVGEV